jgi:hypothetical protein
MVNGNLQTDDIRMPMFSFFASVVSIDVKPQGLKSRVVRVDCKIRLVRLACEIMSAGVDKTVSDL